MRSTPLARILCVASVLVATRAAAQTAGQPVPPASAEQQPLAAQPAAVQPAASQSQSSSPQSPPQSSTPQTPNVASVIQTPPHAVDPVKARYNVQVMEAVLERAVRYAAGQMNRRLQAVSPDLLQLSGAARARGFRLPGYGVFFDVDVPAALRHTMGWTLRLMQQSDQNVQRALNALKQSVTELDSKQRAQADEALKLLETRFQPPPRPRPIGPSQEQQQPAGESVPASAPAETVAATSSDAALPPSPSTMASAGGAPTAVSIGAVPAPAPVAAEAVPAPTPARTPGATADDLAWAQNPDLAYEMEVRDALASAMLEYGSTLSLGADEYLTIAARDSENVVMPGDLSETVTVLMRIKGSDLYEYKAGHLTEADARRRIELREF